MIEALAGALAASAAAVLRLHLLVLPRRRAPISSRRPPRRSRRRPAARRRDAAAGGRTRRRPAGARRLRQFRRSACRAERAAGAGGVSRVRGRPARPRLQRPARRPRRRFAAPTGRLHPRGAGDARRRASDRRRPFAFRRDGAGDGARGAGVHPRPGAARAGQPSLDQAASPGTTAAATTPVLGTLFRWLVVPLAGRASLARRACAKCSRPTPFPTTTPIARGCRCCSGPGSSAPTPRISSISAPRRRRSRRATARSRVPTAIVMGARGYSGQRRHPCARLCARYSRRDVDACCRESAIPRISPRRTRWSRRSSTSSGGRAGRRRSERGRRGSLRGRKWMFPMRSRGSSPASAAAAIAWRRLTTRDAAASGRPAAGDPARAHRRARLPSLKMPTARGWEDGRTPIAAPGLKVNAFAAGLQASALALRPAERRRAGGRGAAAGAAGRVDVRLCDGGDDAARQGARRQPQPHHAAARRRRRRRRRDARRLSRRPQPALRHGAGRRHVLRRQHRRARRLSVRAGRDRSSRAPAASSPSFKPGGHWTRSLLATPDGAALYVGVGSLTNIADKGFAAEEGRAAIHRYDIASGAARYSPAACAIPSASRSSRQPANCGPSSTSATGSATRRRRII